MSGCSPKMGEQPFVLMRDMKIRLEIEGKNAGSLNYRGSDCADLAINYLNSIEADEVQVHLVNDEGTKVDAEFEGEFPAISAAKFILSAARSKVEQKPAAFSTSASEPLTLRERLELFLRFEYRGIWFSSLDVKRRYENVYGNINLSTVSTYLARMHHESLLEKRGNRNQREYRFKDENLIQDMEKALIK